MDTKSTSSKKFSFLLAGALVAAATAVFFAFYPALGEQADYHYLDYFKSDAAAPVLERIYHAEDVVHY